MIQRRKRAHRVGLTRRIVVKSAARSGAPKWALRLLAALASAAHAGAGMMPVPDYDFRWAVIGDPGNPAWQGGQYGQTAGRGGVDYLYRMSVLEVSSAQWLEFINIFAPQSDNPDRFLRPSISGLRPVTGRPGAYVLNPFLANAGQVPVKGITWRDAAMYVNWLNNGKSTEWEAIQNGAYDAATFTQNPPGGVSGTFNDQLAHDPDAMFWIPTLDEWMKAAHWDPNKHGEGKGGWWQYPGMSDVPLTPGQPGEGQTSAGLGLGANASVIPLGAFSDVTSPWGLLDTSGGASEWTEEPIGGLGLIARALGGAVSGSDHFAIEFIDSIDTINAHSPDFPFDGGLRIASTVSRSPDLNADGAVGSADLSALLEAWGDDVSSPADLTLDGVVDGADLGMLLGAWGATPRADR